MIPDLDRLQHAADALKQSISQRNAAGLALASAKTDLERKQAALGHAAACDRVEELKRELLKLASGRDREPRHGNA